MLGTCGHGGMTARHALPMDHSCAILRQRHQSYGKENSYDLLAIAVMSIPLRFMLWKGKSLDHKNWLNEEPPPERNHKRQDEHQNFQPLAVPASLRCHPEAS
jgi:hypothetical protein